MTQPTGWIDPTHAPPQIGDRVWNVQDDPDDEQAWSRITKVLKRGADGTFFVETDYPSPDPEDRCMWVGWDGVWQVV